MSGPVGVGVADVGRHCLADDTEYHVEVTVTATGDVPAQYTDCHAHDAEAYVFWDFSRRRWPVRFCVDEDGQDVALHAEGEDDDEDHDDEETEAEEGENCHYHAGVQ